MYRGGRERMLGTKSLLCRNIPTMFCRGKEHLKGLLQRKKGSVLWEHCESVQQVAFKMEATAYFREPLAIPVMKL